MADLHCTMQRPEPLPLLQKKKWMPEILAQTVIGEGTENLRECISWLHF